MSLFEFTFKEGDTFKHTFKSIETYVNKNVKSKAKLEWKPRIAIQVFAEYGANHLEKELTQLKKLYSQTMYIAVYNGMSLQDHITIDVKFLWDEKVWVVEHVQYPPFFWNSR